ncbi:hypothetical protein [Streptomyces sp. NPDC059460]|uniref:hypothetical protein n=1 Tax=Streptomyces sp. NPDC059460 TaxID=3346840 RepID=UPI0036C17E7C
MILCANAKSGSGRRQTLPGFGYPLFAHVERHGDDDPGAGLYSERLWLTFGGNAL